MNIQSSVVHFRMRVFRVTCMILFLAVKVCQSIKTKRDKKADVHAYVFVCTHYLFLPWVSGAEGGGEGGGAGLAVPRHVARLCGAADGQGVNAVGVAVTVAAVLFSATITRGPDKDGAQSATTLWYKKKKKNRGGRDQ